MPHAIQRRDEYDIAHNDDQIEVHTHLTNRFCMRFVRANGSHTRWITLDQGTARVLCALLHDSGYLPAPRKR